MAFIEPMLRNKPNITYLLTCIMYWNTLLVDTVLISSEKDLELI